MLAFPSPLTGACCTGTAIDVPSPLPHAHHDVLSSGEFRFCHQPSRLSFLCHCDKFSACTMERKIDQLILVLSGPQLLFTDQHWRPFYFKKNRVLFFHVIEELVDGSSAWT